MWPRRRRGSALRHSIGAAGACRILAVARSRPACGAEKHPEAGGIAGGQAWGYNAGLVGAAREARVSRLPKAFDAHSCGGTVEELDLPNTNSPEVMEQAISAWLTNIVWDQHSRAVHPDELEKDLLAIYDRVYKAVKATHTA